MQLDRLSVCGIVVLTVSVTLATKDEIVTTRYLVTANLLKICYVYNVNSYQEAIIAAQTQVFEHKPTLWERVKDCEWLATDDLPPVDDSQPVVEFYND